MTENCTEAFASNPAELNCVLVAVDFSEDSKSATIWASRQATISGKPLVLLHVVHDPASDPGFYLEADSGQMQPMRDVAERMMEEFIESILSDLPELSNLSTATRHLVPGLPPSRIIEVSNLLDASILVIGSRGLTGISNMLLGSVANRVVKISTRPVVVIKSETSEPCKKELKKTLKRQKKDRKKLKALLGLKTNKGEKRD